MCTRSTKMAPLSALLILGCAQSQSLPPPKPLPELIAVRLLVPAEAEVSWTDGDCAAWAPAMKVEIAQLARGVVSTAGFTVAADPTSPHDAVMRVSASLALCSSSSGGDVSGFMSITIDPGSTVTSWYSRFQGSEAWKTDLVRDLQSSPQILALAKRAGGPPIAARPATPETRAGAAPAASEAPSAPPAGGTFLTGAPQRDAYALVIGIERYRDVASAPGARADAERFAAMARTTLGVPDDHVKLATDERASRSDIEKHLKWLSANVPAGGRLFFHFSGHGAPDASAGTSYLVPFDGDPKSLAQTAIPLSSVLQSLGQTGAADVIAFVDACFSGAGGRSVLPPGTRPLVRVQESPPTSRVALYSGATGAEVSGPLPDGQGGLFSSHVLEALGKAEADIDGDGRITLSELSQWVTPRVSRQAKKDSREQTPSLTLGAGMNAAQLVLSSGLSTP